jgi:hypothetical protein
MFSFEVLRAEGFSFSVDILHKEKYVAIFARKYAFFAFVKFTTFGHQIPGSGSALRINKNTGPGSALKPVRIHNTAFSDRQYCVLKLC